MSCRLPQRSSLTIMASTAEVCVRAPGNATFKVGAMHGSQLRAPAKVDRAQVQIARRPTQAAAALHCGHGEGGLILVAQADLLLRHAVC